MRRVWWLAGLIAALVLLLLQAWPGAATGWRFDRERFEQGAWFLVWSAQWVHLDWGHACANALGLGVLAGWGAARWGPRVVILASAAASLAVAAVLAWDVNCRYYAGASGWLHGLLAAQLWLAAVKPKGWHAPSTAFGPAFETRLARLILPVLVVKLLLERWDLWPQAWDFPVYTPAHWAGVFGGSLVAAALLLKSGSRPTP